VGDLAEYTIIMSESDLHQLDDRVRDGARLGVVAQTTQPIAFVQELVAGLKRRFPDADVHFIDTVCQPTKQRQNAAIELAQRSDVVVVIGGAHSNNTHELVRTCARHCQRVHHVQTAADLQPDWFTGARTVGITAGTSTPDGLDDQVESWLKEQAEHAPGPGAPTTAELNKSSWSAHG